MATPTFVTYQIDKLAGTTPDGSAAAVALIDSSLGQTENALNDLSGRIETLNTKSAIIRQHVPLADGVGVGSLVYYDTAHMRFDFAQALTLAETGASGQTIEAPQARVEGIVIATDLGSDPQTGTLLTGGYWEDADVTNACLNVGSELATDAAPGIYYLSPVNAGKATMETDGHLRQPVLSYYGAGKFSMSIFYMAHDNHFHASQVLDNQWILVAGSTVESIAPVGAQYVYGGEYSYGLGSIGPTTALFYKGELQDTWSDGKPFKISQGNIWYMDDNLIPGAGDVIVFNHYPFAYDTAVVRSVTSTNDAITVTNTNGMITLTGNDFVDGPVSKSSYAVSAINGNKLSYTPLVTDVVAGAGISINRALDGSVYVATFDKVGALMDAYSINHNGTTLISNGTLQYITFPAGRISSFVMVMPVSDITAPCNLYVWGMKLGNVVANNTLVPTQYSAELTVSAHFIPDPTTDAPSTIATTTFTGTLRLPKANDPDDLTYGETEITGCTVSGSGLLVATVSVSTQPESQIQLLRTGFKLSTINSNVPTRGVVVEDSAITQTMQVGDEDIKAGDAVMILNGLLTTCVNTPNGLNDTTNKCVGIATTDAAAGEMLTYVITGTMTLVTGALPGKSLYIDRDGSLTTVDDVNTFMPTVRYLQKVGTVLTGNKIQVNIESAVRGD